MRLSVLSSYPFLALAALAIRPPVSPMALSNPYPVELLALCGNCGTCLIGPGVPFSHNFTAGGLQNGFQYHGCWIGPCNEYGINCSAFGQNSSAGAKVTLVAAQRTAEAIRSLEAGVIEPIVDLIGSSAGRVTLNVERHAVQVGGCNTATVGVHVPLSESLFDQLKNRLASTD